MYKLIFTTGLIISVAFISASCSGGGGQGVQNCIYTPTYSSCVDDNVKDPGPAPGQGGASVKAYAVYEGDCLNDPSEYSVEIFPQDGVYMLKNFKQMYSIWFYVDHLQVSGWRMKMKTSIYGRYNEIEFDESDEKRKSPVGMCTAFNMSLDGHVTSEDRAILRHEERRRDLSPQTHSVLYLEFRVPPGTKR